MLSVTWKLMSFQKVDHKQLHYQLWYLAYGMAMSVEESVATTAIHIDGLEDACSYFNEICKLGLNWWVNSYMHNTKHILYQPTHACLPFVRHTLSAMVYQAQQKWAQDPWGSEYITCIRMSRLGWWHVLICVRRPYKAYVKDLCSVGITVPLYLS